MNDIVNLTPEQVEEEKSKYTRKIEIPIYEPKGKKPNLTDLCNTDYYDELISEINAADVPEEIKVFLRLAASRHIRFHYGNVADFYAHTGNKEIKRLFERSALVIIDYDDAIKNGFIEYEKHVTETLNEYKDSIDEETLIKNLKNITDKEEKKEAINKLLSENSEQW